MQRENKSKMSTLLQKLDKVHSYYTFAKRERERRVFISQIDSVFGNLHQAFCKHLFVRTLLERIFDVENVDASMDRLVAEIVAEVERALKSGDQDLKDLATTYGPRINDLISKINGAVMKLAMEVSSQLRDVRDQVGEKRKLLKIPTLAKVLGFGEKALNELENFTSSLETKLKQNLTKDDIVWLRSKTSQIKSLIVKLAMRSSTDLLQQKLKLKRDEAEAVSKLISGESLALNSLDMRSINKLKEIFGDAVQISLKK